MSSAQFVEKYAQAEPAARARLDAGCRFINHKIEQLRQRFFFVTALILIAVFVWWQVSQIDFRAPLTVAILAVGVARARAHRELARWYKQMVINRVVEVIGHGLTYSHKSTFLRDQFRRMDLFEGRIDNWKSEDQITGRRNVVEYALHEVRATRTERRGKHSRTIVVFQGVIAVLEFNKNFAGHTVVVPASEAKVLAGLLGESESRRGKQLVRLADAEFGKIFAVYATDDQEAHYLLTPKLLELVRRARNRFGDIRLAFFQNSLYVALPSERDRFEVGLFSKVTPMAALDELADVVGLAEQLVDVLDLETRIWSRA